jgi:putative DNA primase/helicase
MLFMAQSEPGVPVLPEEFDCDPWLMAVANGTIDLRTGKLRESDRSDLITMSAPVTYSEVATAPTWEKFLERVLPDPDVRQYVQKAAGYSITGDVSEQVLFFPYGGGANGKSTLLNTLRRILGSYGRQASPDLLMFKYGNEHPTAMADLRGRRLVTTAEVQEGRRMAEVMVKQLTGGDTITARRMREDFSSFEPTHKIWLAANHKPIIRGTDHAIWRRIRLIPFTVEIPEAEQDPMLAKILETEAEGILRWLVVGCLMWQREGLESPAPIRAAVDDYRYEMDQVGQFIADRCDMNPTVLTGASVLRKAYEAWCEANGERPMSATAFGLRLQEKGLRRIRSRRGSEYEGIGIREGDVDDSW